MERTETQRKILEVGKKEFLEKGFKDASLNQIVAEAGFTKGAFYGYYPDKTALFEDLVGETASELLTRLDRKSTRLNSSHVRTSRMPSSA